METNKLACPWFVLLMDAVMMKLERRLGEEWISLCG